MADSESGDRPACHGSETQFRRWARYQVQLGNEQKKTRGVYRTPLLLLAFPESEIRRQVRSQSEIGNEQKCHTRMKADDIVSALESLSAVTSEFDDLEPFESPIEEELCRVLLKYLGADTKVSNQVEFETPNGKYRVDFLLQCGDRKVVLEANGKEFHNDIIDIYRGAFILGFSDVQSVFYIRGCDITYSLPTVLYAISQFEPYLFSERGLKSLDALSEVKEGRGEVEYSDVLCRQTGLRNERIQSSEHPVAYSLTLLRKHGKPDKWERVFKAALENPGVRADDFDELFVRSPHYFVNVKGEGE